jgi:hypothetical protein
LQFLEKQKDAYSGDYGFSKMIQDRIQLMGDDKTLSGRLKVLDYLVKEKSMSPPNVLSVIRWRQCGVLRWLVESSYIDLHVAACKDPVVALDGKGLMFLGGRAIPNSMTVGEFLCFAAIEFDDLQSFEWLVSEQNVQLSSLRFEGLNAVHLCTYLGRAEIFLWLMESQPNLKDLAQEECTRSPWRGCFATHIAAEKGFTFLAELLLSSGCPLKDREGKTAFAYAKQSKVESVSVWGHENERPFQLEEDIKKLLSLLKRENIDPMDIKTHISETKCLDPMVWWRDCAYDSYDVPGPLGKTYRDILDHCFMLKDPNFLVWLCRCLSPPPMASHYDSPYWSLFWKQDSFLLGRVTSEVLDANALKCFASNLGDTSLSSCLDKAWAGDISCVDPYEDNCVLALVRTRCDGDVSVSRALDLHRDEQLRLRTISKVKNAAIREIRGLFLRGAAGTQIGDLVSIVMSLASQLALQDDGEVQEVIGENAIVTPDGRINLEYNLRVEYSSDHPIRRMVQWHADAVGKVSQLYVFLPVEGQSKLIKWLRSEGRSKWNSEKELCVVRIASYMGNLDVTDIFLRRASSAVFHSSESECYEAALLGAAEAGRVSDVAGYWHELEERGSSFDPVACEFENLAERSKSRKQRSSALSGSLVGTVVHACLRSSDRSSALVPLNQNRDEHLQIVNWIVSNAGVTGEVLVHAISFILPGMYSLSSYEQCIDLLVYLVNELQINLLHSQKDVHRICNSFLSFVGFVYDEEDDVKLEAAGVRLLRFVSEIGVDLQPLKPSGASNVVCKTIDGILRTFQNEQRQTWSQFDLINDGRALGEIKQAVDNGEVNLNARYREGLLFTHLSAAYDRLDVLKWLVEAKGMSCDALDAKARSVLEVARACNAVSVVDWFLLTTAGNVIATFVSSHFRRRRALERTLTLIQCIRTIQAMYRGSAVRRAHRSRLLSRLDEMQRFHAIWEGSMSLLSTNSLSKGDWTWQMVKQQEHDIMRIDEAIEDEEMFSETTKRLEEAAVRALSEMNTPPASGLVATPSSAQDEEKDEPASLLDSASLTQPEFQPENCDNIKLTSDVVKWLRRCDNKFREFFARRMKQLAAGDRSRILAKRLTGSETLIYETYLEQKSGQRILWTESDDGSLLIWYVAKHKSVSRLMGLIDDAENRSSRQLTSASTLPNIHDETEAKVVSEQVEAERIMLDPLGDTPLKLYEVAPDEIEKLSDPTWKPRLHLTTREREVVETPGTVLLLGRSGTGKTCVIGNRMDYDRQRAADDPTFSQLFVARSQGLCDYVKEAVDGENNAAMRFDTFSEVVSSLEGTLPPLSNTSSETKESLFLPSKKMDFSRFKRDFYKSDLSCGLDALVVWANIRSFIKGSIEALLGKDQSLSEDEYMDLGKKRCRLSPEQRKSVYATFERYDKYMKELGLWDDCDRVTALARRLEHARASDSLAFQEVKYNKLYVDEVQDYTQAEIAVFFYLCGPGDLFLAGDPAQSVVEGVEFRFEEIRSVGYHLYGEERRHLIPDKPKTVHVNFRSHCGILNVAAAVLSCLFRAFPDSAKQLKEDRGLFQGPRPGVFHKVEGTRLEQLVSKRDGIVVLTHDQSVSKWKRVLKDYPLVYGIREAKGLEFQEVILVDFFADIPTSLQKLWRNLLLGRDVADISGRPEIEGHLKLLYTATTRCIQRLFFAETSSSVAGDAFVRWLTTTSTMRFASDAEKSNQEALAVKNSVETVEKMVRTPDEWRSAGLDNAVMAESAHELSEMETWLDRALYCFEQVGDSELASRARTHRASIRFRLALARSGSSDEMDAAQTELDAALLVEQLLSERLYLEAKEVCTAILPLLAERAQENLQSHLISRLEIT